MALRKNRNITKEQMEERYMDCHAMMQKRTRAMDRIGDKYIAMQTPRRKREVARANKRYMKIARRIVKMNEALSKLMPQTEHYTGAWERNSFYHD